MKITPAYLAGLLEGFLDVRDDLEDVDRAAIARTIRILARKADADVEAFRSLQVTKK